MSATVPNLEQMGQWLNAIVYRTDFRPVPLKVQLCFNGKLWNMIDGKQRLDTALPNHKELESISGQLQPEEHAILSLVVDTIFRGHQAMVFCPTKNWCEKLTSSFAKYFEQLKLKLNEEALTELKMNFIENGVKQNSLIFKNAEKGVAFHHAGMMTEERNIVESGFRNGTIKLLIATTTLSSGVNLPARLVIIRTATDGTGRNLISSRVFQQMCGRAGRKGVDDTGHAVLICNQKTFKKSKSLMTADTEIVKSQLDVYKLRRTLLESVATGMVKNSSDAEKFIQSTLFHIQENEVRVLTSQIEDVSSLKSSSHEDLKNQLNKIRTRAIRETFDYLVDSEFVTESDDGELSITKLGEATIAGQLAPQTALKVFDDLMSAKKCLNLETEFHLIYLCTPMDYYDNPDWEALTEKLFRLPPEITRVSQICQVDEQLVRKIRRIGKPTKTIQNERKIDKLIRFFNALAIYDLIMEKPLVAVSSEYGMSTGQLQSLQQSASQYAGMVTAFCDKLSWVHMTNLLKKFQSRIESGVQSDLLDLVRCQYLNSRRARAFHKAGFTSLSKLAKADLIDVIVILKKIDEFISNKLQTGETNKDLKSRQTKQLLYLPGIKDHLTYEEAAELIFNDAKLIAGDESATLSSSQFEEANSIMNTFDETFTKIISRTQKHNLSKPKFNKSIKHQTSFHDSASPRAPRKSLSKSQFNSQKTLLNSLQMKKITRKRDIREHDDTVTEMLESSSKPFNEAIQDSDWSDSDQSDGIPQLSSDGTPDIDDADALSNIEDRFKSSEPKNSIISKKTKNFKAVDISKDSNYSSQPENVDESMIGNVPLDDHIESGDETQVDSQDEICSPQKNSQQNSQNSQQNCSELQNSLTLFEDSSMMSLSEEESENITKKQSLSDSNKTDPTSLKRIRVEPEILPKANSPKALAKNQPEVRDSFFDTLEGESQFLKQVTGAKFEVKKSEDDSFMKTMIGESQFVRPLQPKEKSENQKVEKKVEDSFDETMPGESQFVKKNQNDELEAFFDEPTNVEPPKPNAVSPFKSPEKRSPRKLSPTKSPRRSPPNELLSALPPNLSPQTKKRIATEAQFRNQPKPRNLINDFSNKISSDVINSSPRSPAHRNLATWSAQETKKPEKTKTTTSTMPSKATRQTDEQTGIGSTNIKIFKDKFGIKYKPISREEFGRLGKRIISNKICAIHLHDGKAYFTTFTSKSDTVYVVNMKEDGTQLNALFQAKTLVVYDLFKFLEGADGSISPDRIKVDLQLLLWHCRTNSFENGKRTIMELWDQFDVKKCYIFKALRGESEIAKCLAIIKLYSHVVNTKKFVLESELNFLERFDVGYVIRLYEMSKKGLPVCPIRTAELRSILKTTLKQCKINFDLISEPLKWRRKLDLTTIGDQKTYAFKILKIETKSSSNSLTNEILDQFRAKHPSLGLIADHRKLSKALKDLNLIDSYRNKTTDRVRSNINYLNLTGRTTMEDPPLQMVQNPFSVQLPSEDGEIKIAIRSIFGSENDLVAGDYSQLELRILADLSKENGLIQAFNESNTDPFTKIGCKWLNKNEISKTERKQIKEMCYGIIYGMGPKSLGIKIGKSESEAEKMMNDFKDSYPKMAQFLIKTITESEQNKFCKTLSGRRRYLVDDDRGLSRRGERVSVNTTIQGTAADLVKAATVRIYEKIESMKTVKKKTEDGKEEIIPKPFLIHQLHDELIYESPPEYTSKLKAIMQDGMENAFKRSQWSFDVKFKVKIRSAKSWDQLDV